MQEIQISIPQNNFYDLLDQPFNLDLNLISLSDSNHHQLPPIQNNGTCQWIWSDNNYIEPDPIKQQQNPNSQLQDIRSARIYQEKMLQHILDQCQHEQIPQLKIDRKNSMATEPGSPLRKKKKIKKVVSQN